MKRLLCNTLIIIMLMGVCFNGCFNFGGLSVSNRFSYAAADNWTACDSSDLVTAFRYYCKSRNLAIEGSIADALTSFTTTTFNNICSTLGIDPTTLQSELKKTTEGNLGLRFLFSNTGITAYNRIFAEFLQNNNLAVGDEVENKQIYSGKYFANHLIYVISSYSSSDDAITDFTLGSSVSGLNGNQFVLGNNYSFTYNNNTYTLLCEELNLNFIYKYSPFRGGGTNKGLRQSSSGYGTANVVYCPDKSHNNGCDALIYRSDRSELYYGVAILYDGNLYCALTYKIDLSENDNLTDTTVNVTTNNNTINNNNYNNNWTIIYNDGDTYIDNDDPEPPANTAPGGGGGGNPSNPDPDDPLGPYDPDKQFPDTPDNPTTDPGIHGGVGSDGTITFPDFNFDIPEINWSLDGLQHKFPFSLPFDLYNCCKLLNAEPETPELDYTINLVVYDWRVNYDLHWLDPAARVIRIFELLAFVVGLILITRRLIGG